MSQDLLKVLIVDDETPARNRLRELIGDISEVEIVGEASDGEMAIAKAQTLNPNVMLLDIRMPVMDGIETAEHAQKLLIPPAIIFTTAYDSHALQAFELNAVDYLLKPIRLERLAVALNKARALIPKQLEALRQLRPHRSHFSIHERGRVLLIPIPEVLYLRAELKYITLRTAAREYLLEDSLTQIEQEFSALFVRIHRNCLVARSAVQGFEKLHEIEGEMRWTVILKGLTENLTISRRQHHIIKDFKSA